jgi:hypothetical protein
MILSAEIDAEHVARIGVGEDLVGVRSLLPVGIGPGAAPPHVVGLGPDRAVGQDPVDGVVTAAVVRREEVGARRMDAQVRRVRAVSRLAVEPCERAVGGAHGVGAHATGGNAVDEVVLVGAVEVGTRRIERQVRRVVGRHDLHERQVPVARAHPEDVDAASRARTASVGSDAGLRVRAHVDEAVRVRPRTRYGSGGGGGTPREAACHKDGQHLRSEILRRAPRQERAKANARGHPEKVSSRSASP